MKPAVRALVAALLVGALGTGCTQATASMTGSGTPMTPAALQTTLNTLFQEHVYLAAAATGAALGGRQPEFQAAAAALDQNSVAIAQAVGMVYGADAEKAFLPLWRRHIGFVVDYTVGLAGRDKAKQEQAVNALLGYTDELGAFLSSANPHLSRAAVADLVKHHILTLKEVIDAQAAGDAPRAYRALRTAAGHMQSIATPLAQAIVSQFPEKFRG